MMRVVVASRNPVKLQATKDAFSRAFPDESFSFESMSVSSGVADQPSTDEETREGARNRAANARAAVPGADFWVGLEGGVERRDGSVLAFAWMAVESPGQRGEGRSSSFFLPRKVASLLDEGLELGDAIDRLFDRHNEKQKGGAVGVLTGDVVTRASFYTEALVLALIPFRNPGLY
ncbi:inosine/xanthosine triphosphatase [Candidatus Woesearchaeota archaeon]|nr:inosine/xanthosine triphosphatase [Candidatus Woesearchaeota archaeon]